LELPELSGVLGREGWTLAGKRLWGVFAGFVWWCLFIQCHCVACLVKRVLGTVFYKYNIERQAVHRVLAFSPVSIYIIL